MKMFILYACAKLLKFSAKKGEDYNIKCNNCFNEKPVTPIAKIIVLIRITSKDSR
jgi:hypothetical protein